MISEFSGVMYTTGVDTPRSAGDHDMPTTASVTNKASSQMTPGAHFSVLTFALMLAIVVALSGGLYRSLVISRSQEERLRSIEAKLDYALSATTLSKTAMR